MRRWNAHYPSRSGVKITSKRQHWCICLHAFLIQLIKSPQATSNWHKLELEESRNCSPVALMCWRSHGTKSRVIREEVGSRRRGEDRKKCSFSLCVSVLSVGTVPATLLQNALIMPRYERSLKGLRCVSLCPFVSPTAYVCYSSNLNLRWHGELACALVWAPADASPLLSPIETGRQNGAPREECQWEWKKGWNR